MLNKIKNEYAIRIEELKHQLQQTIWIDSQKIFIINILRP